MSLPDADAGRLRVLHLGSPTGLYGAERWILALVKHLPSALVESIVAVVKDSPQLEIPLCREAERLGVRTQIFESLGRFSYSAIGQIRRFIVANGIHILHSHGYKTDILGRLAIRGTACRTVATPHGWSTHAGLKLKVYEALDRLTFLFLDAVAPLSPSLYAGLDRIPGMHARLHLIPNALDLSEIDSTTEISAEIAAWRAQGDLIVGYVGQLIPRKGVGTLVRAFGRLRAPNKRLVIVGEGESRGDLERLARAGSATDRIHFLGYRHDRIKILWGLDIFVLPSRLEGIPRCLMEAMAAGAAVVATDIPGCRELVTDGATGLLFRVADDEALADRLSTLLANRVVRLKLGQAGSRRVRNEHSAQQMAAHYVELYATLGKRTLAARASLATSR